MITWNEIIAECGNYRDGFVKVFRRHEGEATDEKDKQGRPIKVTIHSFAGHIGVNPATFHRWVRSSQREKTGRSERSKNDLTRDVLRAARSKPEAVVDAIMDAPDHVQDEIYHDLKLRRAGVDTSRAGRKGADAAAHARTEPIKRAMASSQAQLCVEALNDATEALQIFTSEGNVTQESMAEIDAAHEAFQFVLTEARFTVS
jgi:transposase-like protein